MGNYDSLISKMNEQFHFKGNKIFKECKAIENAILVLNKRIPWYKPWQIFSHMRRVKKATILLATIAASCLAEVINLQQHQLDMLEVQKAFQQQLENMQQGRD